MPATHAAEHLVLEAATAADLMSHSPISVNKDDTLTDVTALMTARGFHAAPVIDETGRPVGVISRSDILIHHEETPASADATPAKVGDVMTPAVFSVTPETPAHKVVEELVQLNVHQLYVVDEHQILVGVVTAHDVLRRLHA
jgi:tRNA nucleotidyltransferase (CCA-adding enzyme)